MDFLMDAVYIIKLKYEAKYARKPTRENEFLAHSAESAWTMVEKYYKRSDVSPIYYAAQVLNSRKNWRWFQTRWARNTIKKLWISNV